MRKGGGRDREKRRKGKKWGWKKKRRGKKIEEELISENCKQYSEGIKLEVFILGQICS